MCGGLGCGGLSCVLRFVCCSVIFGVLRFKVWGIVCCDIRGSVLRYTKLISYSPFNLSDTGVILSSGVVLQLFNCRLYNFEYLIIVLMLISLDVNPLNGLVVFRRSIETISGALIVDRVVILFAGIGTCEYLCFVEVDYRC